MDVSFTAGSGRWFIPHFHLYVWSQFGSHPPFCLAAIVGLSKVSKRSVDWCYSWVIGGPWSGPMLLISLLKVRTGITKILICRPPWCWEMRCSGNVFMNAFKPGVQVVRIGKLMCGVVSSMRLLQIPQCSKYIISGKKYIEYNIEKWIYSEVPLCLSLPYYHLKVNISVCLRCP